VRTWKSLILMSLALALPAMAGEKSLDTVDIKAGPAGFQAISGTLDGSSPVHDRIYGTVADSDCGTPVFDSVNNGMAFDDDDGMDTLAGRRVHSPFAQRTTVSRCAAVRRASECPQR